MTAQSDRRNQPATPRSGPLRLWRRSVTRLREGGPGALLVSAAAFGGLRRLSVYRILDEQALARGAAVPEVTVGVLLDRQIPAYRALRPEVSEAHVRRRLHGGAECIAAWRSDRLVAVRWVHAGRADITYLGATIALQPGVWYAFDAYTQPEERRQGISGMVTAELVRYARSRGATAVINAVLPENGEGRGLAERRSQPIGMLRSLRLGPWRVVAGRLPPGYFGPLPPGPGFRVSCFRTWPARHPAPRPMDCIGSAPSQPATNAGVPPCVA